MKTICYIGYPSNTLDHKWMNYFAEKSDEYKVIAICSSDNTEWPMLSDKIKVYPIFPNYFPIKNLRLKRSKLKQARTIMDQHGVDVIHVLYAMPNAIWGNELRKGEKLIISTRGSDVMVQLDALKESNGLIDKINKSVLSYYYLKAFKKADAISCTSGGQIKRLQQTIKRDDLQLIRSGIDTNAWQEMIDKLSIEKNEGEYVIFSPRISSKFYHTDRIVEAFEMMRKEFPDQAFRLALVNYKNAQFDVELKEYFAEEGLNDVIDFLPRQDVMGMAKWYKMADVVVSVPKNDGTPNSVMESQLTLKPAIVGPIYYDPDLFDGDKVWITKSFSAEDIFEKMKEIYLMDTSSIQTKLESIKTNTKNIIDISKQHELIEKLYN